MTTQTPMPHYVLPQHREPVVSWNVRGASYRKYHEAIAAARIHATADSRPVTVRRVLIEDWTVVVP